MAIWRRFNITDRIGGMEWVLKISVDTCVDNGDTGDTTFLNLQAEQRPAKSRQEEKLTYIKNGVNNFRGGFLSQGMGWFLP